MYLLDHIILKLSVKCAYNFIAIQYRLCINTVAKLSAGKALARGFGEVANQIVTETDCFNLFFKLAPISQ